MRFEPTGTRPADPPGQSARPCLVVVFAARRTAGGDAAPETDNALATICGIVETSAKDEGLPIDFFTRLIWRESAFHADAVSPAGAQGVAQFMPGTASERGLADPFDPAAAIPESAKLLAELELRFGNLGLAAAAYNAGPTAVAKLARRQRAPLRDAGLRARDHRPLDVEDWRDAEAARLRFARARGALSEPWSRPCARGRPQPRPSFRDLFAPWGVQIAGSFSKAAALARLRTRRKPAIPA